MVKITFHDDLGVAREVDAEAGHSLMRVALAHQITGIVAECGGNCACATCHVYLDEESAAKLPAPSDNEADMLDFTAAERRPGSRLGCQVIVTEALQGTVVQLPETQV